jgi:chemotaxis protein MotB
VSAARRHKKHHEEEHENHERWLVSGYDMMTLLFAVFVVLFAISSTNVSKVKELQQSLQEAFSGPVLTGGRAIQQTGDTSQADLSPPEPPLPSMTPKQAVDAAMTSENAQRASVEKEKALTAEAERRAQEERDFQELKRRIDALVRRAGLLTDHLLFDSGSAVINAGALATLDGIGRIVAAERKHPVVVEGHTDNRPIVTSQYPSNWQLSGGRAAAVVQRLAGAGVAGRRMSLGGYAAQHPVATNRTSAGRAKNRRVEIILTRMHGATPSHGGDS